MYKHVQILRMHLLQLITYTIRSGKIQGDPLVIEICVILKS